MSAHRRRPALKWCRLLWSECFGLRLECGRSAKQSASGVNVMTKLWSYRWTVAKGYHWKLERECSNDDAKEWLAIFERDEPTIVFKLSASKPWVEPKR